MALGIGETLRAARRQQRRTLSDAAAETRVRETYLAALEEEEFSALGGDVYVKGFLRSYARYLGLDPDPLVAAYRREFERGEETPTVAPGTAPAMPASGERPPQFALIAGGVAFLVLVLIAIGIRSRGGNDNPAADPPVASPTPTATVAGDGATVPAESPGTQPTGTEVASPGETIAEPNATASPGSSPTRPSASASPNSSPLTELNIQIAVTGGPSWMRVTVDGDVEVEDVQPTGTTLTYSAEESVLLRIGDASRVRVSVNGEDQGVLGGSGEVINLEYEVGEAA